MNYTTVANYTDSPAAGTKHALHLAKIGKKTMEREEVTGSPFESLKYY